MPIFLISADSKNKPFSTLSDMNIDVLLESEDPRSKEIGDRLSEQVVFGNRIVVERLNEDCDEDAFIRMQAVLNMVRNMNVRSAMIISHDSVFERWTSGMVDEWTVIPM